MGMRRKRPSPHTAIKSAHRQAAGADFLVTGNTRHFPDQWKNTRIVNARELIEELATEDDEQGSGG